MIESKYATVFIREAVSSCLLCNDAPCTAACKDKVDCSRIIRSLRFDNKAGALAQVKNNIYCVRCTRTECMTACLKGKISNAVPIQEIICSLQHLPENDTALLHKEKNADAVSLAVDFCGIHCENPFFLSSSVVASNYDMIAKAFDKGWAGAAFKTIGMFVPEEVSPRFCALRKEANTFIGFKNIEQISDHTLEENLDYIRQLKKQYR